MVHETKRGADRGVLGSYIDGFCFTRMVGVMRADFELRGLRVDAIEGGIL